MADAMVESELATPSTQHALTASAVEGDRADSDKGKDATSVQELLAAAQNKTTAVVQPAKKAPICPKRLILLCSNLSIGLVLSQLIPEWMPASTYFDFKAVVKGMQQRLQPWSSHALCCLLAICALLCVV